MKQQHHPPDEAVRRLNLKFSSIIVSILLLCLCSLCGCMRQSSGTELILGTIVNIKLYGKTSQAALDEALNAAMDRTRALEQIFSVNIESSELNYVNQNAYNNPVKISNELYTVLERSLYFARLTDGAFDPTLGNLIRLWGIGTENARVPSQDELSALLGLHNYEHVVLDEASHTVTFTSNDFTLDLGAIAKGYAADEIKKLLTQNYGITCATISLGGNVITIGASEDGDDWNIGIAQPDFPEDSSSPAVIVHTSGQTLVTSGDYQRYYDAPDGKRYHHILDSRTGYPSDSGLRSVSIITETSMDADALSTAVFVMGQEDGMKLIESMEGIDAVFIDTQNNVTCTSGIKDRLSPGVLPLN